MDVTSQLQRRATSRHHKQSKRDHELDQQQYINDDTTVERNYDIITTATATETTKTHSDREMNLDETTGYSHQCFICDKIFSANSNLNRHLRKIHQENVQSPYNNVKCALCDSFFASSAIYNIHLENDHQVKIEVERLTFADQESFQNWKHSVENETTSQFIKSRGEKRTKNVNKTYYSCNRSGYYVSKARTRKALKKQGSRKINGRCPASMNVTINTDSSYDVRFVKTHVGHDFDLKHLDLSDKDRDLIVQKLASGITKKDLIKQIRSASELCNTSTSSSTTIQPVIGNRSCVTINEDQIEVIPATSEIVLVNATPNAPILPPSSDDNSILNISNQQHMSRLHLATTKDIHNILNSKHLDSKKIRHNYDLNNVEAWIQEMKVYNEQYSVLFYKSQDKRSEEYPKLSEDDFLLIVMKYGQAEILKQFGEKCVIIDSTHNVHCEYLQVTYIAVVDEGRRGFPVAFLFSTRTNADVLDVFFRVVKERVGALSTRMLLADDLHDFYQAWWKVMSMPTHNLLTPWSVFDTWSKKFYLISNKMKLRKIKKLLRTLLTEVETDKFSRSLKALLGYKSDREVAYFVEFFEENYAKNPDIWSSCLRKNYNVWNTHIWRLHEKFKLVYKEGKNSKKMCKYIANLMNLFEDYQLDKLIELESGKPNSKEALNNRHKNGESVSLVYEVAVDPPYWLCPSEKSNEIFYEVRQIDTIKLTETPAVNDLKTSNSGSKCDCSLKCPSCATCRHEYKCTCLDYVVNLDLCKHIHRICTMCK